ncbi:hypothetical protein CPC08DRAFT_711633 [Agrocybe pediades]|nr:hypothetical protein CPC08DRAFT_711633 [Agrocybe pediades]
MSLKYTLVIAMHIQELCLRCPELPVLKLWDRQSLEVHLRVKHDVHDPRNGVDWSLVQIISGTFLEERTSLQANQE